jgi:hypothetical protein
MLLVKAPRSSIGSGSNKVVEGTDTGSAPILGDRRSNRHCLLAFAGTGCVSDARRIDVSLGEKLEAGSMSHLEQRSRLPKLLARRAAMRARGGRRRYSGVLLVSMLLKRRMWL